MADGQAGYSGVVYSEDEAPYTGAEGYTGVVRGTTASGYTGTTSAPSPAPSSLAVRSEVDPIPVIPEPLETPAGTGESGGGSIELGGASMIGNPPSYEGVVLEESGGESTEIVFKESEVEAIVARPPSYDGVIIFEESEVEPIIATGYSEYEAGGTGTELFENVVEEDLSEVRNGKRRPSYTGVVQGRSASGYKGVTRPAVGPPGRPEVDPIPVTPPRPDRGKIPPKALYKLEFKDCREAIDYIESLRSKIAQDPTDESAYIALSEWAFKARLGKIEFSRKRDETWTAQVRISYSLLEKKSDIIKFPTISWPNMTQSESEVVESASDALLVHEQGHFQVARDFVKARSGRLIRAWGAKTREEARDKLIARVKQDRDEQARLLASEQQAYDTITQHGYTQSEGPTFGYPGGKDTKFECPGQ
jgi:hypothetical protein